MGIGYVNLTEMAVEVAAEIGVNAASEAILESSGKQQVMFYCPYWGDSWNYD